MIPRFKPQLNLDEFKAIFGNSKGAVEKFKKSFAKTFQAVDAVSFPYGRSALCAFLNAVEVKTAEMVMPAYPCSVVAPYHIFVW